MYSEIEVFSFYRVLRTQYKYLPSLILADMMTSCRQISGICAPIIRIIEVDWNISKILLQLPKICVGSASVVPSQNDTRIFVHGIPSPTLIGFFSDTCAAQSANKKINTRTSYVVQVNSDFLISAELKMLPFCSVWSDWYLEKRFEFR